MQHAKKHVHELPQLAHTGNVSGEGRPGRATTRQAFLPAVCLTPVLLQSSFKTQFEEVPFVAYST